MPGSKPAESTPSNEAKQETAPSTVLAEQPPASGEQTPVPTGSEVKPPVKERFEDNPGFKALRNQANSFKSELQKAQELNTKLMTMLENQSKPKVEGVASEQEAAAKQLRQILGIDDLVGKIQSLDKRNSEFNQSQTDSAFDKEQESIAKQCEKFGLDMNVVVHELQGYLDSHPYFSKQAIQPGFYDLAFKSLYFDKSTELAKNAAYAEQVKTTQNLKKANSEAPNPGSTPSTKSYTGIKDRVKDLIEQGGGVSFPGH